MTPAMIRRPIRRAAGFTLIEAIVAIAITGILGAVVAVFISKPIQGYFDSVLRAELTDQADVALRRITRDLRLALPNSLRVTTFGGSTYIEFIMTTGGGRYRADGDGSTGGDFLSYTNAADTTFHVLGKTTNAAGDPDFISTAAAPLNPDGSPPQDYIAVYNLGTGYNPANAYNYSSIADACGAGGCNIARATAVACAASPCTVTLSANPFAAQAPPLPAPDSRFQIVPGAVRAVTYACPIAAVAPAPLTRQWNYGFTAAQGTPPAGGLTAVLAAGANCTVTFAPNASGRNGLLLINLTLTRANPNGIAETVTLSQQIRIDNTP